MTDEARIIEAMAQASYEADKQPHDPPWERLHGGIQDHARKVMRAALAAARPLIDAEIIERCAKVAEDCGGIFNDSLTSAMRQRLFGEVVDAIRSLAKPEDTP